MSYITTFAGEKVHDPRRIADAYYYSALYSLHTDTSLPLISSDSIQTFLDTFSLHALHPAHLESLNSPITSAELISAIIASKSGKIPGLNGLPNEYFKTFKSILSYSLLNTFHPIIVKKHPPKEILKATVITIAKPGKSPDILSNYHPISLLNCDIKLFSKIHADRIN